MGIEFATAKAFVNKTTNLTFQNTVLAQNVGVSYWTFTYGSDDHHIETLSLDLQTNTSGKQVSVRVNAKLSDDSGNHIDDGKSYVQLVAVAVTGNTNNALALTNQNNIGNGGQSTAIPLPGSAVDISVSYLSGFDLSYGSDDHHLETMSVTAGANTAGSNGYITGAAQMYDDSGNHASTASINGAYSAQQAGAAQLIAIEKPNLQTSGKVTVDMGQNVSAAVAALTSMKVSFGSDDHHVRTISGGAGSVSISGSTVTIDGAHAKLSDDSGNKQKDSDSHVSLTVFGVPS